MVRGEKIDYVGNFPEKKYPRMTDNQRGALKFIAEHNGSATVELPTGSGKTAVGYAFLKAIEKTGKRPLFYIVPTKTLVEQVKALHPDLTVAMGRNEHLCLYRGYADQPIRPRADEIPCSMLQDCPHRVDQGTGATFEPGAEACPYLQQKFQAKQAEVVVCTAAFYLFTQAFSKEFERPAGLVVDEAHQIAKVLRSTLSFDITDHHVRQAANLLKFIGARQSAREVKRFLQQMLRVIRRKPARRLTVLETEELQTLIRALETIDARVIEREVARAIREGRVNPVEHRSTLRQLEVLIRDLRRYVRALEYSCETEERHALNYTCAYYTVKREEGRRVQYKLVVKAYYVVPLVKRLLGARTLAYSATIGDAEIFGYETGIQLPFKSFGSDFPAERARIFMPTDTPDLTWNARKVGQPRKILRRVAHACRAFSRDNLRSLVVVVSEAERQAFLELAEEEGLGVISYGNGLHAKDVALAFRGGQGETLVGTVANFGEGLDLPKGMAPIIFFLRPGYPRPDDPLTVFEDRRFGGGHWKVRRWRVMIEALQARGRNIRSTRDKGVTFFISQHFRKFLYGSLPAWLVPAYRGELTFDECVAETRKLLLAPKAEKIKV